MTDKRIPTSEGGEMTKTHLEVVAWLQGRKAWSDLSHAAKRLANLRGKV